MGSLDEESQPLVENSINEGKYRYTNNHPGIDDGDSSSNTDTTPEEVEEISVNRGTVDIPNTQGVMFLFTLKNQNSLSDRNCKSLC